MERAEGGICTLVVIVDRMVSSVDPYQGPLNRSLGQRSCCFDLGGWARSKHILVVYSLLMFSSAWFLNPMIYMAVARGRFSPCGGEKLILSYEPILKIFFQGGFKILEGPSPGIPGVQ